MNANDKSLHTAVTTVQRWWNKAAKSYDLS